jgi:hypothetical protein
MKEAARSLAHEHFKSVLEADFDQAAEIKKAWDSIVFELDKSPGNIKLISKLNIPEEEQAKLLKTLQEQYEASFTPDLVVIFKQQFEFTENFPSHATRFGRIANLDGLLEKYVKPEAAAEPVPLTREAVPEQRMKVFDKTEQKRTKMTKKI